MLPHLPGFGRSAQRSSLRRTAMDQFPINERLSETIVCALVSNDLVTLMLITNLDFRSAWWSLSLSNRLFLLSFTGVGVYTLSLCLYVHLQLQALKKQHATEVTNHRRSFLDTLARRLANLRQLLLFTSYLFGFCIVFNIPNAFVTLGLNDTVPVGRYIRGLTFLLYFDAAIFLGFLILHTLQWMTSARVDYFARQCDSVSPR
jgi:hypothetical protein